MKNNGTAAEDAFESYWRKRGAMIERFRDLKDLRGLNATAKNLKDFPKPADYVVCATGVPLHFAEVKSTQSKTSFPFGDIRPSQSSAAKRSYLQGDGGYRFYIFSYPLGRWFVMTAKQYHDICETGKASAKFTDLEPWIQ